MRAQELEALVREVVEEEPTSSCADEGTQCALCGCYWNHAKAFNGLTAMVHDRDCWITRARAVLADTPPSTKEN